MFNGINLTLSSYVNKDTYGKRTKTQETQHTREPRGQLVMSTIL